MNYSAIRKFDSTNGLGIGTSIFLTGCRFHCPDCFNSTIWDETAGQELTDEKIDEFVNYLSNTHVSHSAILGGEPLLLHDPERLTFFLDKVKSAHPNKPMWMWTGYTLEELKSSSDWLDKKRVDILEKYVDYLVDGKFIKNLATKRIIFRGSENQIIWRKNITTREFERCDDLMNFKI